VPKAICRQFGRRRNVGTHAVRIVEERGSKRLSEVGVALVSSWEKWSVGR